jgi:integrase/recombinase XerD
MQILHNSTVIEEYIESMRREINISDKYKTLNFGIFRRFARFHMDKDKKKDWKEMTQNDVMAFLDSLRKPEAVDPLHKWIGTYNLHVSIIIKFFKWLYYPDIAAHERPRPDCVRGLVRLTRKKFLVTNLLIYGPQKMIYCS